MSGKKPGKQSYIISPMSGKKPGKQSYIISPMSGKKPGKQSRDIIIQENQGLTLNC